MSLYTRIIDLQKLQAAWNTVRKKKTVSCLKLREQYKSVTAEIGCSCTFRRSDKCYPSPVLHAISLSGEDAEQVTLPISQTISK